MADPDPPDDALLVAAHRGDRDALEALARRYWTPVRQWAPWETGDPQLAEEVVQEAMVRLVRFVDRCAPGQPFAPWMRTLVRHAAADAHGRVRRWDRRGPAPTPPRDGPDRTLDLGRAAGAVLAAFRTLTPRQREVLQRVDGEGTSAAEVARDLELAPGTVRSLLFHARAALRAHLGGLAGEIADLVAEEPDAGPQKVEP